MAHNGDGAADPITLRVLWNRLDELPEEMGLHLRRTAFSSIIKYSADLSTALFSWDGRLISQGVYTPGFLGCMPTALDAILTQHFPPETWEPGDVVVTNNPYIAAGHFPDIFTFEPVFVGSELAGFAATVAHHADLGGKGPGSGPIDAANWYEEGLQLPPLKLYEGGEPNQAMLDTILANSQLPEQLEADLKAQRAASVVGRDRYAEIVREYGFDEFKQYVDEIVDRTERTMRDAIEDVPDGTYEHTETLDGVDEALPVRVAVTVDGDELCVDFAGTADQQDHYAINSTRTYTFAYTLYMIKTLVDPDTPHTAGAVQPVLMRTPERSLVDPEPPVPLSKRHVICNHIAGAINGALYQAIPDATPACGAQEHVHSFNFADDRILIDCYFGGAGARAQRDGNPAVAGVQNIKNAPIETIEEGYPVRITRYELRQDTGGAGRYRGGAASVREYKILEDAEVQSACERYEHDLYGLGDGETGTPGSARVHRADGSVESLGATARFSVAAGDRLVTHTVGGGGYGDPRDRDSEAVRRDVADGLVSPDAARDCYGVDPDR